MSVKQVQTGSDMSLDPQIHLVKTALLDSQFQKSDEKKTPTPLNIMYKHPITTTMLSPAKIRSALITSPLLREDEDKDAPPSSAFITDACQSALFLAVLVVAAARGMFHTVTLQEKLSLQGSGCESSCPSLLLIPQLHSLQMLVSHVIF